MAKDISAVGAKIVVNWKEGGISKRTFTIDEFSDEGTPFDCPDVDVSTNAKNLNGEMISSRTPSVYPFSITVIPRSLADSYLAALLAKSALQKGNVAQGNVPYCDITVTIPTPTEAGTSASSNAGGTISQTQIEYTFTNARIKSGPTGPSTSADGRLAARTYSFEAEGWSLKGV